MRFNRRAARSFVAGVAVWVAVTFFVAPYLSPHTSFRRFDLVYRPLSMVLLLIGFAFLLTQLDGIEERPLASIGLGLGKGWWRDAAQGLLLGAGMIIVAVVLVAAAGGLHMHWHVTGRTLKLAAAVVVILSTGAMAEELMFRGYPFQRLVDAVGPVWAIVGSSALFGVVHLGNPDASVWGLLNTIAVGVLFSLVLLRTHSLWMCWGIHFAWNITMGLIFGLPVSGENEFSVLVESHPSGPSWLTGGAYGVEAGVAGAVAIAFGFLLVLRWLRQRAVPEFTPEQPMMIS